MKKILLSILLLSPALAFADTYQVSAGWTDPTPVTPEYTPTYQVEWRVNGGVSTPVAGLSTPSWSAPVVTAPGDNIEVRVQNINTQGSLASNWSAWTLATAPAGPTQPSDPTSVTLTVTRTGP